MSDAKHHLICGLDGCDIEFDFLQVAATPEMIRVHLREKHKIHTPFLADRQGINSITVIFKDDGFTGWLGKLMDWAAKRDS